MFASWYAKKDAALMKGGTPEQLDYAGDLLAELLNRAQVVKNLYLGAYEKRLDRGDKPGGEMDYQGAVDQLLHGLGIFCQDVNEALARARRARLVYGADSLGEVSTGSVDPDVNEVGGSLVPWHEDEPAPPGYQKVLVVPKASKKSQQAGA